MLADDIMIHSQLYKKRFIQEMSRWEMEMSTPSYCTKRFRGAAISRCPRHWRTDSLTILRGFRPDARGPSQA